MGLAALMLIFESQVGRAQSCPEGTWYPSIEDRGEEKIVHCRKPGLDAAIESLGESAIGKDILAFLTIQKIPVLIDSKREWDPNVGAAFDPRTRQVVLPPDAAKRNPMSLAVSIAHEGYHARQYLARRMVPCIEVEQDATFIQFVVYVELAKRNAGRLGLGDPIGADYAVFARAVRLGSSEALDRAVETVYQRGRERVLHMGSWLPPPGRILFQIALRFCDVALDLTEDFEKLNQRKLHPGYLWDKVPVNRSEWEHLQDELWKEQWIKDHQFEDLPGF